MSTCHPYRVACTPPWRSGRCSSRAKRATAESATLGPGSRGDNFEYQVLGAKAFDERGNRRPEVAAQKILVVHLERILVAGLLLKSLVDVVEDIAGGLV